MCYEKAMHIDVKYNFVWDVYSKVDIFVKKIIANNTADMLTKLLSISKFKQCLNSVGIWRGFYKRDGELC